MVYKACPSHNYVHHHFSVRSAPCIFKDSYHVRDLVNTYVHSCLRSDRYHPDYHLSDYLYNSSCCPISPSSSATPAAVHAIVVRAFAHGQSVGPVLSKLRHSLM
jgi:hypothetical protein